MLVNDTTKLQKKVFGVSIILSSPVSTIYKLSCFAFAVSPSSSCSISGINFVGNMTTVPHSQLEMLEATHRGLHKFNPRHHDEIEVEIGDPIYVQKEADDLWCEGNFEYHLDSNIITVTSGTTTKLWYL